MSHGRPLSHSFIHFLERKGKKSLTFHLSTWFSIVLKLTTCLPRVISYHYPQCYIQWVCIAPLSITFRIKTWVVAYFFNFMWAKKNSKKNTKAFFCNFLVLLLKYFLRKFKFFLPIKSWKNHPQKLLRKTKIHFLFLTAWAAQTVQTELFMFQNVAYRTTVYRTGTATVCSVWPSTPISYL